MNQKLRKIISFFRWRIISIRYITLLMNLKLKFIFAKPKYSKLIADLEKFGYSQPSDMSEHVLNEILEFYKSKIESVTNDNSNQPFKNIMTEDDLVESNPLMKYVFSDKVLGSAFDYFGNNVSLNAIQLLYSYPTPGKAKLKESQHWHKDFGDSKSLHSITYLNDIFDQDSGPFTFINKIESKKISWSPFVRRIPDVKFVKELGSNESIKFFGKKGSTIFVDPASCYHFGSRGNKSRLALFVSFNTNIPFTSGDIFTNNNSKKLRILAKKIRPDINPEFFDYLIR